jgi:hypothetical protein
VIEEAVSEQQSVPASSEGHNGGECDRRSGSARDHGRLRMQSAVRATKGTLSPKHQSKSEKHIRNWGGKGCSC